MDTLRLDSISQRLSAGSTRRRMLGALAALPAIGGLVALLGDEAADAKDRRRRRKQRHRRRNNPGARKRSCRRKPLAKICDGRCGEVKNRHTCGRRIDCGPCCTPDCGDLTCCGTSCAALQWDALNCGACGNACPANHVCAGGSCLACTVSCDAANHVCDGAVLQAALAEGGNVVVCPGRYTGTFSIADHAVVTVVGAGMGDDPAASTILDAQGAGRTLQTGMWSSSTIRAMRFTGGDALLGGGLHFDSGSTFTLEHSAVAGNRATGVAGGLHFLGVEGAITDCLFTGNLSTNAGGAIFSDGVNLSLRKTTITRNTAEYGGGIGLVAVKMTLADGTTVTGNTAHQADGGGGLWGIAGAAVVVEADAVVRGNTPNDCVIEGTLNGVCG
ncbi:MAG: hypothetical protein QM692_10780 [Thermomicrobiales bacterium]